MIPSTAQRVPDHTPEHANERIRRRTVENLARYGPAGTAAIDQRLRELEHEWDLERVLEANAASVSLFGLALGVFGDRRWLALPAAVAGFLLQHALQGWCPPSEWFRRSGVRTAQEIARERYALKLMRGDFNTLAQAEPGQNGRRAQKILEAVEA